MNFAEAWAYWYLRLNGFFLIRSFVVHRPDKNYKADIDVLAIRPRHVYEVFGGQPEDWDARFDTWGLGLDTASGAWLRTVGLTVEVKAGGFEKKDIKEGFFGPLRISEAVGRLGLAEPAVRDDVSASLADSAVYSSPDGAWTIGKLLVYEPTRSPSLKDQPILSLPVLDAKAFVKARMMKYQEAKSPAFEMFPSELVQDLLRA